MHPVIIVNYAFTVSKGPMFPAVSELLSEWAPVSERTLLASVVFSGFQLGFSVTMTVTPHLLSVLEWQDTLYVLGGVAVLWFIVWTAICFSKPSQHPFISAQQLHFHAIHNGTKQKNTPTPWKAIFRSKPFWVLLIAVMGHYYGLYTMTTKLPQYYIVFTNSSYAHNFDLAALPFMIMWMLSVLLGYFSDLLITNKILKTTELRRMIAIIGAMAPGLGMAMLSYVKEKPSIDFLLVVSMALMGCSSSSLLVNPLDLSPNHAATLMALLTISAVVPGVCQNLVAVSFTGERKESDCHAVEDPNESRRKMWQNVMWVMFAVLVTTNLPFAMCGSGDEQPWNRAGPARVTERASERTGAPHGRASERTGAPHGRASERSGAPHGPVDTRSGTSE